MRSVEDLIETASQPVAAPAAKPWPTTRSATMSPAAFQAEGRALSVKIILKRRLARYDDAAFVRGVYQAVLEREPDASGMRTFLTDLREKRLTRDQILTALILSPEAQRVARIIIVYDWINVVRLIRKFRGRIFDVVPSVSPGGWLRRFRPKGQRKQD